MAETRRQWFRRFVACVLLLITILLPLGPGEVADAGTPAASRSDTGYRLDVKGVQGQTLPRDVQKAQVHKIVDGDTIEIVYPPDDWWYKVRLIGINAPESVKPNSPVQCYGKEASKRMAEIIPVGATVYLERDVSDEDQYGRLLRHVWVVDDGTGKAYLVSELLTRGGYVDARRYRPDDKYDERLAQAELAAKHEDDGLWGACAR
jgi:micrococcal nuclease